MILLNPTMSNIEDVLSCLRRVIRAADIHSKKLTKTAGLTSPQLLLMQAISNTEDPTIGAIAKKISLSQATATNIVTRLEARGFLTRERSQVDKRYVFLHLTAKGEHAIETAPTPLQENFVKRFGGLEDWEQSMIIASLQRLATMMDAEEIDASPFLEIGDLDRAHHDLSEVHDQVSKSNGH